MKNENINRIKWQIIGIAIFFSIIMGLGCFIGMKGDSWGNYWQIIGAIVSVCGAVYIFFIEQEKKNRKESIDKIDERMWEIEQSKWLILDKMLYNLQNNVKSEENIEELNKFRNLVLKVDDLTKSKQELGDSEEKDLDPLKNGSLIYEVVSHEKFEEIYGERLKEFDPQMEEKLKKYKKNKDNEDNKDNIILGEWIIATKNAEKAKMLIGISGYTNKVLGIYRLKDSNENNEKFVINDENGRIIFKTEIEDNVKVKDEYKDKKLLENWDSRNPILYPNRFDEEPKNYKKDVMAFLNENIEWDDSSKAFSKPQDIIVVKSFEYDDRERTTIKKITLSIENELYELNKDRNLSMYLSSKLKEEV